MAPRSATTSLPRTRGTPNAAHAVAKVVYNFGRADEVDADDLRRLASSILRVVGDGSVPGGAPRPSIKGAVADHRLAVDRHAAIGTLASRRSQYVPTGNATGAPSCQEARAAAYAARNARLRAHGNTTSICVRCAASIRQ